MAKGSFRRAVSKVGRGMRLAGDDIKRNLADLSTIKRRRKQVAGKLPRDYPSILDFVARHQPMRFFPWTRYLRNRKKYNKGKISDEQYFKRGARFAPRYTEEPETLEHTVRIFVGVLQDLSQRNPDLMVASTGCGTGVHELYVATKIPRVNIDAVDYAKETIEEAQRMKKECGDNQVKFGVGTFEKTRLKSDSYNLGVSFNAIQWVGKPGLKKALLEQKRILKKDGKSFFLVSWIQNHNRQLDTLSPTELVAHQIPESEMVKTAQEAGFELVKKFSPPLMYWHAGKEMEMPLLLFRLR